MQCVPCHCLFPTSEARKQQHDLKMQELKREKKSIIELFITLEPNIANKNPALYAYNLICPPTKVFE